MSRLLSGTIRAQQGDRHLVVTPDGARLLVRLVSDTPIRIGADVIGQLSDDDDPTMKIVPDVTRTILRGKAKIIPIGRPDVTARMLARLLRGMGPASIKPGVGGIIERTPEIDDVDIAWALRIVDAPARAAGIAFNMIDAIAMARSSWSEARLKEEILPADVAGETSALRDLQLLLNDGMTPSCRRTIETIGRGTAVASVDFVLPYSPFATGFSWSADIARATRNEIVGIPLSGEFARRISTFRELALTFAPRYLGRVKEDPECQGQAEATFADTAAIIALLRLSGSGDTVNFAPIRFQRLREAALARWDGTGRAPVASNAALATVASIGSTLEINTADDIFRNAAGIARSSAPNTTSKLETLRSSATDRGVFVDLEKSPPALREVIAGLYRADLDETVTRLGDDGVALRRMAQFGVYHVPLGFEDVFDQAVAASPAGARSEDVGISFPADPWVSPNEALASRMRVG